MPRRVEDLGRRSLLDDRAGGAAGDASDWKLRGGGVIPWIACAVILWLLTGLTQSEWIGFGVCLALGSALYVLRDAGRRRAA